MSSFTIVIEETLRRKITVDTETECEALQKVMKDYHDGTIVLTHDDFSGDTQFKWSKEEI